MIIYLQDFLHIDADSHVYQLLLAKLQMGDLRNFDSRLYMCNEAFHYMDVETLGRLSESGLLPIYCLCVLVYGCSMLKSISKPKNMTECQSSLWSNSSCNNNGKTIDGDQEQSNSQNNCIMRKQESIENLNSGKSQELQNMYTGGNGVCKSLSKALNGEVRRNSNLKHCDEMKSCGIIPERPDLAFFVGKHVTFFVFIYLPFLLLLIIIIIIIEIYQIIHQNDIY